MEGRWPSLALRVGVAGTRYDLDLFPDDGSAVGAVSDVVEELAVGVGVNPFDGAVADGVLRAVGVDAGDGVVGGFRIRLAKFDVGAGGETAEGKHVGDIGTIGSGAAGRLIRDTGPN